MGAIPKPRGNHKLKIYNRYTPKRKRNPNPTLKSHQITKEENKRGKGKKKKELQNQIQNNSQNGNKNIHITIL